jgi:putative peptidoglycan lipid II flippase
MDSDTPPHSDVASAKERVNKAAGVVGSATLLSRILGYVRDMVIASFFGAGLASDAFIAAFRIPNMLRRLFGEGSLSIAFVPIFTDCLNRQGRDEAERLAARAIRLLVVILLPVALLGVLCAPFLVHLLAYGFTDIAQKYDLCVKLTRIMFPYIVFIGLVALSMGILNVLGHFAAPALAPVLLNVGMIGSAVGVSWISSSSTVRVTGLAVGVLIGGMLQLGFQVPFLVKHRIRFWRSSGLWHPALANVFKLMGPAVFGAAVYQINHIVGTFLGSLLAQGSISFLYYADRLVQFPLGVFAIALATAVLPTLSQQASDRQWSDLRETFRYAMQLVFFISLPAMVGLIVLREPIVSLLFQRGEFDLQTTRLTASALLYYAIGLWAFSAVRIVLNTFYALMDTRTPVIIAIISIAANALCGGILMWPMKHNGLALALSISSILNLVLLTWALRRKLGALGWRRIAFSAARSATCAALMGLCVWALALRLLPSSDLGWARLLAGLTACMGFGAIVFGGVAFAFKAPELQALFQAAAKRKPRN